MKIERIQGILQGIKGSFFAGSTNPLKFQLAATQKISNYPTFYLVCKIKHEAHLLDKAVKNPFSPGRASLRRLYLIALLNELIKRNLNYDEITDWAKGVLNKYDSWVNEKKPQVSLGNNIYNSLSDFDVPSIRFWKKGYPSTSLVIDCIRSAQNAPASCNRQAFLVKVVINDMQDFKYEGARNSSMFVTAPYRVFIYFNINNYSEKYAALIDLGMFAQNFVLKAKTLGLGTCCCYASEHLDGGQKCWRDKFNLSNEFYCGLTILVGTPREIVNKPPRVDTDKIVEFIKG